MPANAAKPDATTGSATSLNHDGSRTVVNQINTARSGMKGINGRPLPSGDVTVHPNGNVAVHASAGRQYELRPNGTIASFSVKGQSASFRPDGRIAMVHSEKADIRHNLNGASIIVSHRPGNTVLVSTGPRRGYLERTVTVGSRPFIQRTYVANRVTYTRVFSPYHYHGVVLEHYVPRVYFAPAFYGWAYYPWATPVVYRWGWAGDPWFVAYNGYFAPEPAYSAPYAWVTDYYLSRTLADSYQPEAPPASDENFIASDTLQTQTDSPITPQLKAEIAEEVRRQIAYENAASTGAQPPDVGELPSALQANHVFVVATNLDVTTADQQTCAVSPGDVLRLDATPAADAVLADLHVASSKRADCPAGTQIGLSLQDLQDMQNNLRANIDSGLEALRASQGQDGLPAAPSSAVAPPPRPTVDGLPADNNANVASLLEEQRRDATKAEQEVLKAAGQ